MLFTTRCIVKGISEVLYAPKTKKEYQHLFIEINDPEGRSKTENYKLYCSSKMVEYLRNAKVGDCADVKIDIKGNIDSSRGEPYFRISLSLAYFKLI